MGIPTSDRASRSEYERRIHRVMTYIDSHLDEPLSLETLAAVSNFSAYHFHRVFLASAGETLGDFLRRRRMETAALRLTTQPRLTVLEAALAVGFGSGEAFTRAFKVRFGTSPTRGARSAEIAILVRSLAALIKLSRAPGETMHLPPLQASKSKPWTTPTSS